MKKKLLFIVNPISGIGKQGVIEREVPRCLNETLFHYDIEYTNAPKHATVIASNALTKGFDAIVAVGGDGLVHEVAKALVNSNVALGIIPTGSGNGLARHLKLSLNVKEAIEQLNAFNIQKIDTISINDEVFVNMAGIGFDAHMAMVFNQLKKRGFFSYIKAFFKEFNRYQNYDFEITIDGGTSLSRNAWILALANGPQYGNNAFIAPEALVNDGVLNVSILKKPTLLSLIYIASKLFAGALHKTPYLESFKAKEVLIKFPGNQVHLDGEVLMMNSPIRVKVNPLSLSVLI